MYPHPAQPAFAPRRMPVVQLIVGTFRILARTWPFLLASALAYLSAVALLTLIMYLIFAAMADAISSSDDIGSVITTVLIIMVIGWFVMLIVNGIMDAPWIGLVAVATDVTIRNQRKPMAREVVSLLRRRFWPLAGVFVVILLVIGFLPVAFGLVLMNMPTAMLTSTASLMVLAIGYVIVVVTIVIFMEFAPWAVLFEGKGVFAAFRRSATLSRQAFLQMVALHLLWGFAGAPLITAGLELPSVLGAVFLCGAGLFVAMVYLTCQGLMYADICAVEQGRSLDLQFFTPAIPVSRAFAEVRQLVGAGAPVAPPPQFDGAPPAPFAQGQGPHGRGSGPFGPPPSAPTAPIGQPWPGARFQPAPGWPVPPPGWAPPANWRPDPAWPPAPAGWQFWR